MKTWLSYVKQGFSRKIPVDQISAQGELPTDLRKNLKHIYPFVLQHWRKGIIGAALILIGTLLSFPQPLISRYFVDTVLTGRQLKLLPGVILLMITISGCSKLCGLLQQFYVARFEQSVTMDIQESLLGHVLRLPKAFFDTKETGYLMSRLSSDVGGLQWFFSSTIVYIITNILRFIGGLCFLVWLEWRLALAAILVLPGLVLMIRYFSGRLRVMSHWMMEQQANVYSRFQECLSSASLIKAFSTEERAVSTVISGVRRIFNLSLEQSTVNSIGGLAIGSMPSVVNLSVLAIGAYWVITGHWTLGSLFAFQSYLGYVFGPAQFLASANMGLQGARASLERVSALFELVPEENAGTGRYIDQLQGNVEFRDVSFSYDEQNPVLQNISFSVAPGERIAVVGPSGVGKTTLISLLLRFYRPTSGEVYFDGIPADNIEVSALRRRIGYVSQSTLLLTGTVIDNLKYGNPEAKDEEVFQAAEAANIHEFILGLSSGYETEIGQNGVSLSEGQRQRLSIARALVKRPDLLVLDEPSSALDNLTEKSIFHSLPLLVRNKTLFVVAHRLSTIQDSDRILLLNGCRLAAVGTHQELFQNNEYYRSLVACQQVVADDKASALRIFQVK
ncbi:MAG TPA: ABC transporter ATP-binding protein [Syntrophorhabdales bacterium]|nr:ABC transporter ATP-binding protein [Syntrophorhabdales bacterium]